MEKARSGTYSNMHRLIGLFIPISVLLGLVALGMIASRAPDAHSKPAADNPITFDKDIAPIVFSHCSACHRPGEAAPFSLLTYQDIQRRGKQIADLTRKRLMPPWLPDPGFCEFQGERRLTDDQINLIGRWVAGGAPEGNPRDLPPLPQWTAGWQIGEPDLIIQLPEPYTVPAEGNDVYRNFVVPIPITKTQFVRAFELRPGNPRVLHHAFILVDRTPEARRLDALDAGPGFGGMSAGEGAEAPDGHFLSWQPGKTVVPSPDDIAWRLEKGSDLVLQMHLRPSGKPEKIQPSVGLYFSKTPATRTAFKFRLASLVMDIPAGDKNFVVEDSWVLPADVDVTEVAPHAHNLARSMKGWATLPDGTGKWLVNISQWDFNWQGEYLYSKPIFLPKGTILSMHFEYDNSADNPRNPNQPPKPVHYGPQTSDEMSELWFQVVPRDPKDLAVLQRAFTLKRLDTIIIKLNKELKEEPRNGEKQASMGKTLFMLGKMDEALPHFLTAAELLPKDAEIRDWAGRALLEQNKPNEARPHFEQALRLDPKYYQSENNLGLVSLRSKDTAGAEAHFENALQINPQDPIANNNLGMVLFARNRLAEAAKHFEASLQTDPDDAYARQSLAKIKALQGEK